VVGGHSHSLLWGSGKQEEAPVLDRDNPEQTKDWVWGS